MERPEEQMVWLLNVMLMVAGGSDHLNSTSDYDLQGCVVEGTYVPTGLVAAFFLTIGFCFAMTILFGFLWLRLHFHKDRKLVEHMPVDIWTWMAQAVAEADNRHSVKTKHLKQWNLAPGPDGGVKIQSQGQVEQVHLMVGEDGK